MKHGAAHGFTLIEVLLSVTIITMLGAVSLPVYASFQDRNNLDIATQSIVGMLRRSQTYTRSVSGDSQWGVKVQAGSTTLFKGASYASRDTNFDEITTIPTNITLGGLSEVVFAKFSAAPSTTGNFTLTVNTSNTRTVSINAKGMVDY